MPKDYSKTAAGETVGYWRAELERAKKAWDVREDTREELRRITSELDFGALLWASEEDRELTPEIDQRDYHIILRFVDRIKGIAGDEEPEVRFSRNHTGIDPQTGKETALSHVGEIQDRLVMRAMSDAGAPEENEDGVGAVCVDGPAAYWWEMTGLPSQEEAREAAKGAAEIVQEAAAGVHEPSRLQDHAEIAEALNRAGASDPEAARAQMAQTPEGTAPFERVLAAGAEHLDEAVEEAESKTNIYWRDGKFRLRCTRYPVGTHFRWDSTVTRKKDIRWVARRMETPIDEARVWPAFRKSVREEIKLSPFDKDTVEHVTPEAVGGDPDSLEAANGRFVWWHLLDRKTGREYGLPEEGVDKFLFDRPAPVVDEKGREILPAAGRYPGFFPVSVCTGKSGTRNDAQKLFGIPLALPGLKGQRAVIKLLSYYIRAVKQASSCWNIVDEEMFEEYQEEFRQNRGGVLPRPGGATKDQRPPVEQFGWKAPPDRLFMLIDQEIMRTLNDLNFPIADFTSRPIADTATQEKIGQQSGNLSAFAIVRQFEMSYSEQAHIALSFVRAYFPDSEIDALIGGVDRAKLRSAWGIVGVPNELPAVKFAARARSQDFTRIKQLLDLHERAKAEMDPLTGAPKYETGYLVQEAAKSLGVGPLEEMKLSDEDKVLLIRAKMAMAADEQVSGGGKGGGAPGKSRDSEGKPRGRRERAGRRDSRRGRARGMAPEGVDAGRAQAPSSP